MLLLWILLLCITAGTLFAALGTAICLRTTASDGTGTVLLRLFGRIVISTGGTAVSLFVIAAAIALPLPAYYIWLNRLPANTIEVTGNFDHLVNQLTIRPAEVSVNDTWFALPLVVSSEPQQFVFSGPAVHPMTFEASIDAPSGTVQFRLMDSPSVHYEGHIAGHEAHLDGTIRLTRSAATVPAPQTVGFTHAALASGER